MVDYDYYRKNNKVWYDETETQVTSLKPTQRILLKCVQCKSTYSDAYKCKDDLCPLYEYKRKKMKRPHTCTEAFLRNSKPFTKQ